MLPEPTPHPMTARTERPGLTTEYPDMRRGAPDSCHVCDSGHQPEQRPGHRLGRLQFGHLGTTHRATPQKAYGDGGHANDPLEPQRREQRYKVTRRITLIGAATNALLAVMQIGAGVWYGSAALIADGVHTLSDLASDAVVLIAAIGAREAPDTGHPYGHGRLENLATTVVALLLLGAAIAIGSDAIGRLRNPADLADLSPWVLVFAAITLIAKETLYRLTARAARRVRSPMLEANAWHHRSDAASSLVVFIGLGVAVVGIPAMDAIAALAVAAFIAWLAIRLLWNEANKLVDAALPEAEVDRIRQAAAAVPGVVGVHDLRTRWLGSSAACDVHIEVASTLSVSEGHAIGEAVASAVRATSEPLDDVTVHIDPAVEGIERVTPPNMNRARLLTAVETRLRAHTPRLQLVDLTLHDAGDHIAAIATLALDTHEGIGVTLPELQALDTALVTALNRDFAAEDLPVRWSTCLRLSRPTIVD
ncbi:MAG: cation diffusion facilitator family transporter [Thioalkalivibrionaceae bacterium]